MGSIKSFKNRIIEIRTKKITISCKTPVIKSRQTKIIIVGCPEIFTGKLI